TEPVTEPATEPVTEPATEPVTEPATEPVTEPVTEQHTEEPTETASCGGDIEQKGCGSTVGAGLIGLATALSAGYILLKKRKVK
ncbi:MAG: hypothetical protein IJW65_04935, partial [Clostridia bacterium]|nr:hypothetical protein [Clostridia bacterium]